MTCASRAPLHSYEINCRPSFFSKYTNGDEIFTTSRTRVKKRDNPTRRYQSQFGLNGRKISLQQRRPANKWESHTKPKDTLRSPHNGSAPCSAKNIWLGENDGEKSFNAGTQTHTNNVALTARCVRYQKRAWYDCLSLSKDSQRTVSAQVLLEPDGPHLKYSAEAVEQQPRRCHGGTLNAPCHCRHRRAAPRAYAGKTKETREETSRPRLCHGTDAL